MRNPSGLLLLLVAAAGQAAEPSPPRTTPLPLLTVCHSDKAPTIDGRIGENEWRRAGKTTGFVNLADGRAADIQTTVYLGYDAQRLYVGFDCELSPEDLPKAAETRRDGSVWSDDSFELLLQPPGREDSGVYHFVGNSLGTLFDDLDRDKNWNGRWEYQAQAARGGWSGELAIPWEDLGGPAPTGQTWRVNFARSVGKSTSWSDTVRGYRTPERFGYVQFAADGLVTQVGPIAGLGTAEASVNARIWNLSASPALALAGVRAVGGNAALRPELPAVGSPDWPPIRRATLVPRANCEIAAPLTAPPKEGQRRLEIAVVDSAGRPCYRQAIPYLTAARRFVQLLADPSEERVFVRADLRGQRQSVPLDLHLDLLNPAQSWRGSLTLRDIPGGTAKTLEQDIRSWPLGTCQVRARLTRAGRQEPLEQAEFEYQRVEPPEWFVKGRTLGTSRAVLKPWTPVEWDGQRLDVWGRVHDFSGSLLPRQITSSGEPLLSQAATIIANLGGQTHTAALGRRDTQSGDPDLVVTRAAGRLGPIPLSLTTSAEYDGMLKFELEMVPSEPVDLDRLRLEVSLPAARALYYHLAGSYYAKGVTGAVPADGLAAPFTPLVWLGDNQRGLTWFAESTEGWNPAGEPLRIQPDAAAGAVRLVVEFIGRRTRLQKPLQLVFGLQATPVKPPPSDWRAWRADSLRSPRKQQSEVNWKALGVPLSWRRLVWNEGTKQLFSYGHMTPVEYRPELASYVAKAHAEGARLVPYFYLHGVSEPAVGFDRYYPAWQTTNPRQIGGYDDVIHGACPGSSYGDYMLFGFAQMVERYGVDGTYFDGGGPPVPCANALHDHGFAGAEGYREQFYPIFGLRRFYKRLATMLAERVANPVIWVHSDGKMASPVYSFVTAMLEGEFIQGPLHRGDPVLSDLISLEYCRAKQMATQWGIPTMWLPTTGGTPEQRLRQARDCLALLLLHGTPIAKTAPADRPVIEPVWKAQADFGVDRAEFYGYWENSDRVQLSPDHPRVLCSLYQRDQRRLVIVSNLTDEPRTVTLKLRPDPASLRDALSGQPLAARGGPFPVTIEPRAFRLLVEF